MLSPSEYRGPTSLLCSRPQCLELLRKPCSSGSESIDSSLSTHNLPCLLTKHKDTEGMPSQQLRPLGQPGESVNRQI